MIASLVSAKNAWVFSPRITNVGRVKFFSISHVIAGEGEAASSSGTIRALSLSLYSLRTAPGLGRVKTQACCGAVEWSSQASDVLSFSREAPLLAPSDAEAQKISKTPRFLLFWRVLDEAHKINRLKFFGNSQPLAVRRAFATFLVPLRKTKWVVYAKEFNHAAVRACAMRAPRNKSTNLIGSTGSLLPRQATCWSGRTSTSLCSYTANALGAETSRIVSGTWRRELASTIPEMLTVVSNRRSVYPEPSMS